MKGAIPIFGTTGQVLPRAAFVTHRVPDFVAVHGLDRHLGGLYGADWYAVFLKMLGDAVFAGQRPDTPAPDNDVQEKMLDISRKLNREVHHTGHWLVVWHRMGRLCLVWRDSDGGLQFTVEFPEPWISVARFTVDEIAVRAEMGWAEWARRMQIVDVKPEQMTISPLQDRGGQFGVS